RDKLVTGVQTCALPISQPCSVCLRRVDLVNVLAAGLGRDPERQLEPLPDLVLEQEVFVHPAHLRVRAGDATARLEERREGQRLRSEEHTSELQSLAYLV